VKRLEEQEEADTLAVRQKINRVYDLAKSVICLMFTLAISIFVLAVGTFFRHKEEAE
jgi:hypothetical protein